MAANERIAYWAEKIYEGGDHKGNIVTCLEAMVFDLETNPSSYGVSLTKSSAPADLDAQTEREQWRALAQADSLHLLPPEALIASVKYLSEKLLSLTEKDDG